MDSQNADFLYTEYCDRSLRPQFKCYISFDSVVGGGDNSTRDACYCSAPAHMELGQFGSVETLLHIWRILCTIMPVMGWFAIGRLCTQFMPAFSGNRNKGLRYGIEFAVIIVPTVLSVNIANRYVEYCVAVMALVIAVVMWQMQCARKARIRQFEWGRRPHLFTLMRSTTNLLTSLCILAIDFASFPKEFRKSRRYGVGLMDVGIGLFTITMGVISRRPQTRADYLKTMKVVVPTLGLGAARSIVIMLIDYHQDEHEYGKHLNAFFTLGLTKLCGSLLSGLVRTDGQLLAMAGVVLIGHELILQHGVAAFVMNQYVERDTFVKANREGLCSLPGFVVIYLAIMYVGKWVQSDNSLTYKQFMDKLKILTVATAGLWLLVVGCVFTVGIARVTCNTGYVIWMMAITITMMLLAMLVFDMFLNTLWPVDRASIDRVESGGVDAGETDSMLPNGNKTKQRLSDEKHDQCPVIPSLVEAINYNGLLYFLLSNILTGAVNIYFAPDERSNGESVAILCIYMFIATTFVYVLYRSKLRIA